MKIFIKSISALVIALCVFCAAVSASAYFSSGEEPSVKTTAAYSKTTSAVKTKAPAAAVTQPETSAVTELPEDAGGKTYALTPGGNLTLIDDYETYGNKDTEENGKQFLTVTTKSGNTLYIIVDRDSDSDNVYLLNLVDEADLMALINDEPVTYESTTEKEEEKTEKSEKETSSDSSEKEEKKETREKKNNSAPVILIAALAAAGGAAWYFLKGKKNTKGGKKKSADDEGFGFSDDDDIFGNGGNS